MDLPIRNARFAKTVSFRNRDRESRSVFKFRFPIAIAIPIAIPMGKRWGIAVRQVSNIPTYGLSQDRFNTRQEAAELFLGAIDDVCVRTRHSVLSPLWRKNENHVRNKFAADRSEDSHLSRTPHKSSAHSACQPECGGRILFVT
jgi:hypothetical protein